MAKEYDVILELKLIADVGLIGFPNVGKSTLLSMVTNANPKIANYHFTTLAPNLGVVEGRYGDSFVLADIPGLVEGASEGVGLGHAFLRHVERTKVFIHVVDAAGVEGDDPVENVRKINQELEAYNPELMKRPQVIAANKTDIPGSEENVERLKEAYEKEGFEVFPISAATNKGLDELLTKVGKRCRRRKDDRLHQYRYRKGLRFLPALSERKRHHRSFGGKRYSGRRYRSDLRYGIRILEIIPQKKKNEWKKQLPLNKILVKIRKWKFSG